MERPAKRERAQTTRRLGHRLQFFILYSTKYASERPATTRMGPDDARCVVWAIGELLFIYFVFFFFNANYYLGHKCPSSFLSSYSCHLIQMLLRRKVK
jgi:hypothetical protein